MLEVEMRQLGKLKPRGINHGAQSLLDSGGPGSVPTALDSWTSASPMCHTALGCSGPLDPNCGWRGLARKSRLARASTNSCPPVLSTIQCRVVGRNFRLFTQPFNFGKLLQAQTMPLCELEKLNVPQGG